MILVTGATGIAGSQVVDALLDRGQEVRVFVRDPAEANRRFGGAVDVAAGDFADPRSVRSALTGVQQLVLSCSDDPRRVAWETDAIDAAATAGVTRIVKLSSIAAAPGAPVAFWDWHGRVEQHLWRASVPGVVLRSSVYMSNVHAAEGRLRAPAGTARIAMIDPADVGAAAASVLTAAGHDGRTYVLTGPEAITYAQIAETLSAATGREVEYVDVTDGDARRDLIRSGVPDTVAGEIVKLFARLRLGAAEHVTATVQALTGRPPRDFAAFAARSSLAVGAAS